MSLEDARSLVGATKFAKDLSHVADRHDVSHLIVALVKTFALAESADKDLASLLQLLDDRGELFSARVVQQLFELAFSTMSRELEVEQDQQRDSSTAWNSYQKVLAFIKDSRRHEFTQLVHHKLTQSQRGSSKE